MRHDNKEMLVPADVIIIYLSSAGTHSGSVSGSHNLFHGSLCSVYSTIINQTISTPGGFLSYQCTINPPEK